MYNTTRSDLHLLLYRIDNTVFQLELTFRLITIPFLVQCKGLIEQNRRDSRENLPSLISTCGAELEDLSLLEGKLAAIELVAACSCIFTGHRNDTFVVNFMLC